MIQPVPGFPTIRMLQGSSCEPKEGWGALQTKTLSNDGTVRGIGNHDKTKVRRRTLFRLMEKVRIVSVDGGAGNIRGLERQA